MKHEYTLVKFNNGQSHNLDGYDTLEEAIKNAKALHDPAWPVWQGIWVIDCSGAILFSTCN